MMLLRFCVQLGAQTPITTATLKGTVTDENKQPLFSATVFLTQNNVRKQANPTDFNGKYNFDSIAPGTYDLTVKYVGYPDQLVKEIILKAGDIKSIDVSMALGDSPAKSVVIVNFKNPEFNRDETTQMEMAAPKKIKNLATRDVKSAVATSSGVVRTDKGISGKGGRYSSNVYYVDGIKMTGAPNIPSSKIYETKPDATNVHIYNSPEAYKHIAENGWVKPSYEPLSTFSIDVDAASYSNMRRFLKNGQLPPPDAVRIEEMINYFNYSYPQPTGEHPFHVFSEMASCPWNPEHKLVHIGIQGKIVQKENLPASNLVFLIDVSGSMSSPDKLPLVKQSLKLLTNELRKDDKVAIVVYAGAAGLVLPSTKGNDKNRINEALDELEAGGSTAGGAGIQLAYNIAKENFVTGGNNRVILATDGDFNVGQSSEGDLVRLIEEKRQDGIFLTVLGYGTGNYQDSKMQELADKGNGNHAYIDDIMEAKKVLVNEFGGTLFTIAKDVKLQVEWNPALVKGYRLIGYENRMLNKEDFNDDKKDAG
ncbi:MAG: YfbK domain-containing protein, partial [Bacteroidia bacterium]